MEGAGVVAGGLGSGAVTSVGWTVWGVVELVGAVDAVGLSPTASRGAVPLCVVEGVGGDAISDMVFKFSW